MQRCLQIIADVAGGVHTGQRVGETGKAGHGLQKKSTSTGESSAAVDILCTLHELVEDEHLIKKGDGDTGSLLSPHLAAWECCLCVCLAQDSKVQLTPAFTCAAAPLAVLWGTPGLNSHAPVRTLLRVWKLMLGSLKQPVEPASANGVPAALPIIKALLCTQDLFPAPLNASSPQHYCSVSSASRLAAAQTHTARLQKKSKNVRTVALPHVRVLHNVLWMMRTVVNHHTQFLGQPINSETTNPSPPPPQQQQQQQQDGQRSSISLQVATATIRTYVEHATARALSVLAVAQLLPTGIALVRSALAISTMSMTSAAAVHMLTDLLLPVHEYIELLLDIVAWPGSIESSYMDAAGDLVVEIGAAELITWEIIACVNEALHVCWFLVLAADTKATTACSGGLSELLHRTTRRLLLLVEHRFHDAVLADDVMGGMAALFLRETVTKLCTDLNTFPTIMTQIMQQAASSPSSSRAGCRGSSGVSGNSGDGCAGLAYSGSKELVPVGGYRDRFSRGFEGLTKLLESKVMTEIDNLTRVDDMPSAIMGDITAFQIRILFWLRAALVPLCTLGPGLAAWKDNVVERRTKMRSSGRVSAHCPHTEYGPDTSKSTVYDLLRVSQPLFVKLVAIQAKTVSHSNASRVAISRALSQQPKQQQQQQHKALPPQLWLDSYNSMCRLLIHAGMSLFFCVYDETDCNPSFDTASALAIPCAYARLPPMQRREAACAQQSVRGIRTGCCNLDCKVVGFKPSTEGETGVSLLRCSQCVAVTYCCRACQKEAWAGHKQMCEHVVLCKMLKDALASEVV